MQASSSVMETFSPTMDKTSFGQKATHIPQPLHQARFITK
jgi:hypothetical protein